MNGLDSEWLLLLTDGYTIDADDKNAFLEGKQWYEQKISVMESALFYEN